MTHSDVFFFLSLFLVFHYNLCLTSCGLTAAPLGGSCRNSWPAHPAACGGVSAAFARRFFIIGVGVGGVRGREGGSWILHIVAQHFAPAQFDLILWYLP